MSRATWHEQLMRRLEQDQTPTGRLLALLIDASYGDGSTDPRSGYYVVQTCDGPQIEGEDDEQRDG